MTKFKKMMSVTLAGCMAASALMMSAGAVDMNKSLSAPAGTVTADNMYEDSYNVISTNQIDIAELDDNSLIKLNTNMPVTITAPNGEKAEYALSIDNTARSGEKTLSVKGNYQHGVYSVYVTLWAKATWGNRTVTITDQGFSYTGTCAEVQNAKSWITNKKGSSNTYAKARTTGDVVWYWIYQGVPGGSANWDFELWLDPANSNSAFLKYNDSNHF